MALYNAGVEKWNKRLTFHIIMVPDFFFFSPLDWKTRKDRNINLHDGFSIVQAGLKWYSTLRKPKHKFKVSFPEMFEFAFWRQPILNSGGSPQDINNEVSKAVKDRHFVSKISFSVPFFPS